MDIDAMSIDAVYSQADQVMSPACYMRISNLLNEADEAEIRG
jgi:hypothetical protein